MNQVGLVGKPIFLPPHHGFFSEESQPSETCPFGSLDVLNGIQFYKYCLTISTAGSWPEQNLAVSLELHYSMQDIGSSLWRKPQVASVPSGPYLRAPWFARQCGPETQCLVLPGPALHPAQGRILADKWELLIVCKPLHSINAVPLTAEHLALRKLE